MCNQEETTLELQNTNEANSLSAEQQKVNNAFKKFCEVFIKNKKSLIVEYKDGDFTVADIENCLKCLNGITKLNPDKKKKAKNSPSASDVTAKDLQTVLTEIKNSNPREFTKFYILLWHCYWIMYLMNDTSKTFFNKDTFGLSVLDPKTNYFIEKGKEIASTEQVYSKEPIRPFRYLLGLIKYIWKENKDLCIKTIEEYYSKQDKGNQDNRIKNILLYLCEPTEYPCIISQNHQDNIYNILGKLYAEETCDEETCDNVFHNEKHVKTIENHVKKDFELSLYDENIRPLWDIPSTNLSTDNGLAKDTLLKYKKAIVLYGPPGTSKSYEARTLAKILVRLEFVKKLSKDIKDKNLPVECKKILSQFLCHFSNICDEQKEKDTHQSDYNGIPHIHRLQLHPGYTYDDFIVGQTIKGNDVQIQKGYLMRLIDDINRDRNANTPYAKLPHILILDEINRVDISRVFGELFTAMEKDYRDTGVDLPVKGKDDEVLKLQVPKDLYIIGTMNMIDFSLEQVDFALRRRFAWIESNYDDDRLKEIVEEKSKDIEDISSDKIMPFVTACTKLNEKISNEPSLGPAYQIGHAFFSEIVDIYNDIKSEGKQNPWEVAKKVLWSISVRPTLDAYCGSMETEQKKQFIEGCKNAFLP